MIESIGVARAVRTHFKANENAFSNLEALLRKAANTPTLHLKRMP